MLLFVIARIAYGKRKLAELQAGYKPEDHLDILHGDEDPGNEEKKQ